MTINGWDLDVPGVQGVLRRTATDYEPIAETMKSFPDTCENAIMFSGSDLVGKALSDFAQHEAKALVTLYARVANCITGASKATNAYLAADRAMAETAMRSASAAPDIKRLLKQ
ncbi:DUF6507 family protein [Spirillospora sp. CA-294931]|uniref:DUF6507 family protein n=1 Tax=Spirillospora sp. CA-294931 TaxID=3240042 RepID=UPI003D925633